MISTQGIPGLSVPEPAAGKNHFLLIASAGALCWFPDQIGDHRTGPGGIGAYLDGLARGLTSLGDTAKALAVVRPDETERMEFLKTYESWAAPFPLAQDHKPVNWLGRKCVSFLEVLRCVSPKCRRILERACFFETSTASTAKLEILLSGEKPAAVVFGHLDTQLYALALSLLEKRRPYGIIAHGSEIGRLPNDKKNDFVKKRMMLQGASWIAANSRHTKSLLEMWRIPSERIKVVYPPISEELMRESYISEPSYGTDDELRLVTVCRLVKGKGVDTVIRALGILVAREIPCRYAIGGDGPERTFLEALVDKLGLRGKVDFKGPVAGEEKRRLLRSGNVFVMPSRADSKIEQEGFGIVFIEAAAFGIPAVASRTGGIPDAVVDGETGILVPQDSPLHLADALTLLHRKPEMRKEMGRTARQRARREFSPSAVAARFRDEISNECRLRSETGSPALSLS